MTYLRPPTRPNPTKPEERGFSMNCSCGCIVILVLLLAVILGLGDLARIVGL